VPVVVKEDDPLYELFKKIVENELDGEALKQWLDGDPERHEVIASIVNTLTMATVNAAVKFKDLGVRPSEVFDDQTMTVLYIYFGGLAYVANKLK